MIKSIYLSKLKNLILLLGLCFSFTSCAIYSEGFSCPDSKGANCMMLSDVDMLVDSGEIETIYHGKKCTKGKCRDRCKFCYNKNQNIPRLDPGINFSTSGATKYYIKN